LADNRGSRIPTRHILSDQKLVTRIAPRAEALPAMLDRLEAFAETAGLPARAAYRLAIVCEELAANVAMHGADGEGAASYIDIIVERLGDTMTLLFEDDGRPFDPLSRSEPDTTLTLENRAIGGLGIHFVRKLVKDITYTRVDRTNRLMAVIDTAE
jgi:serine/threonine-protein kinase RsbW